MQAPATELYWAVVPSLVDAGTVSANVMRRDTPDKRIRELIQKGKKSECDLFWLPKLRAGALWISGASAPAPHELLATPTVDVHSGVRMASALDVLRHLWFHRPGSFAPAHVTEWRHADSIADTIKYLQKHVPTPQLKSSSTRRLRAGAFVFPETRCQMTRPCSGSTTETRAMRTSEDSAGRNLMCCTPIATDGSA